MNTLPLPDLQTLAALVIGLVAAMHVLKRWWPQWRRLWAPKAASGACAASVTPASSTSGAACGSGCGQCGHAAAMPSKDHRVHIVRRHGR